MASNNHEIPPMSPAYRHWLLRLTSTKHNLHSTPHYHPSTGICINASIAHPSHWHKHHPNPPKPHHWHNLYPTLIITHPRAPVAIYRLLSPTKHLQNLRKTPKISQPPQNPTIATIPIHLSLPLIHGHLQHSTNSSPSHIHPPLRTLQSRDKQTHTAQSSPVAMYR